MREASLNPPPLSLPFLVAEGACTAKNTCSLWWYDILAYKPLLSASGLQRPQRLMRVLYESIEDLHLLSQCTRLATQVGGKSRGGGGVSEGARPPLLASQASSHFSTFAAMLMWGATGGAAVQVTHAWIGRGCSLVEHP